MADAPSELTEKEICEFLKFFAQHTYAVGHSNKEPRNYMAEAVKMIEKDYTVHRVNNKNGQFCPQYPETIPIMIADRTVSTIYENIEESSTAKDFVKDFSDLDILLEQARMARCRQRFPVPVILVNGKYICRSSTLADKPEICYRSGLINFTGYELYDSLKSFWWPSEGLTPDETYEPDTYNGPAPFDDDTKSVNLCDRVRYFDVKLLKTFNVNTIVDIMVENRKIKHSLIVSSSEKVVPNTYSSFNLVGFPYPGCEFFKEYYNANFNPEGLKFDWTQPMIDAALKLPEDQFMNNLAITWDQYKEWDVVTLTQNYMKYILKRLQEDSAGLLLHCISGWDRTPMFMSLLRLSLWADYLVHPNLNEIEILYLTLTYDWYLFGHHLQNRLYKHEEIMAFCFDFLRYISGDEYSLRSTKKKYSDEGKTDDSSSSRSSSSMGNPFPEENSHKKNKMSFETVMEQGAEQEFVVMDTEFEDLASGLDPTEPLVLITDDDMKDIDDCGELRSGNGLSPTNPSRRRTSPIQMGGRRQRSESTGSNSSNVSATWQLISDSGSVEKDFHYKPLRTQRLEKVRAVFTSCFQKTVKTESFGPPSKWTLDDVYGSIGSFTRYTSVLNLPAAVFNVFGNGNGNVEETAGSTMETNGN